MENIENKDHLKNDHNENNNDSTANNSKPLEKSDKINSTVEEDSKTVSSSEGSEDDNSNSHTDKNNHPEVAPQDPLDEENSSQTTQENTVNESAIELAQEYSEEKLVDEGVVKDDKASSHSAEPVEHTQDKNDDHAAQGQEGNLEDGPVESKEEIPTEASTEPDESGGDDKKPDNTAEKIVATEDKEVNYELLSKEDLADLLAEWLANKSIGELGNEVNDLLEIFKKKIDAEISEKKKSFLESGGDERDFKPADDPVVQKMSALTDKYKALRAEFNKQLEVEKEQNLAEKNDILEQFRLLVEKPEAFESTFRKFKQLQKRWFEIGIVPKQNVRDLWNSYNFFVDKFNDYVNINRELRNLDYKKNYDQKVKLCEKAEALINEKSIVNAFKKLQKYHAQWREIGPVQIEEKDKIWERFKAATSVINKSHQEYQSNLKASLADNYKSKTALCEKAEAIAEDQPENHKEWVSKTNELLAIQKEWKTIGYAPKKVNNEVYSRFRKACDKFFAKKAAFYAKNFEEQKEHLEKKREIVEEAESLKDSTDWKQTTDKLIGLQKKWKDSGPVPSRESDKLWRRFRAACDYFFAKKSAYFSGDTKDHQENLKLKEALISEVNMHEPSGSIVDFTKKIQQYQNEYYEIGFVPIDKKDQIRDDFKQAIEKLVERSGFSGDQKSFMRFRLKIQGILSGPRPGNKLAFERDKLFNKLQQLKNDIGVLENNVGFFKQTESSEDTISDFQKKIDDAKDRIQILEKKIDIIDELDPNA